MKIAVGADHGGFRLKDQLASHLKSMGHEIIDVGTSSDEAVDYPVFAQAVAMEVAAGRCERGIMVDGAGIGSAIAANKVPGVRAALAYDLSSALNSREHNDANLLTLGAGLIGAALARQIVEAWLQAKCTEERHLRRVGQIGEIEQGHPEGISEADLDRIAQRLHTLVPGTLAAGTPSPSRIPPRQAVSSRGDRFPRRTDVPEPPSDLERLPETITQYIDHTLLKPDATAEEIAQLCAEAREHDFAAVCVNPAWIKLAAKELRATRVTICAVVGFPLGAIPPEMKALEARRAIREGASEIDMVINVGALKAGSDELILNDIRAVVEACRDGSALCKVILETGLLNDGEKRRACRLARKARAHFVKTSTGFGPGGATVEDITLMANEVRDAGMGVKASGGIRTYADAKRMIVAGATRIGASAGVKIVKEARAPAASTQTAQTSG